MSILEHFLTALRVCMCLSLIYPSHVFPWLKTRSHIVSSVICPVASFCGCSSIRTILPFVQPIAPPYMSCFIYSKWFNMCTTYVEAVRQSCTYALLLVVSLIVWVRWCRQAEWLVRMPQPAAQQHCTTARRGLPCSPYVAMQT